MGLGQVLQSRLVARMLNLHFIRLIKWLKYSGTTHDYKDVILMFTNLDSVNITETS